MKNLTLIIPAKHESESLPKVLEEIKNYECKIIVILEDSDLKTINSIKNFNCKILYQSGRGFGNALIEGMNSSETEYTCIFNADGSFNPNEISKIVEQITKNNKDFIFASRYEKQAGSEDDTIITLIGNYFFSLIKSTFFEIRSIKVTLWFCASKIAFAKPT